jgi:hypothetical protein
MSQTVRASRLLWTRTVSRFTGPYNLADGMVPVVDGIPRWPWDEVVARRRLGQVAKLAGLRLTGDEVFVESGSNDTWFLSGETVLQVCYRGDVDRLVREAELLAVLPGSVPGRPSSIMAVTGL